MQPLLPLMPRAPVRFVSEMQSFAVLPVPRTMPAAPPLSRAVLLAITQPDDALIPGPEFEFALQAVTIPPIPGAIPALPLDAAVEWLIVTPSPDATIPLAVFERAVQSLTVL